VADHRDLEPADHGLGEGVVIAVADILGHRWRRSPGSPTTAAPSARPCGRARRSPSARWCRRRGLRRMAHAEIQLDGLGHAALPLVDPTPEGRRKWR
jgi:hypothetical protein